MDVEHRYLQRFWDPRIWYLYLKYLHFVCCDGISFIVGQTVLNNASATKFLSGTLIFKKGKHNNLINIVRTTSRRDEQTNPSYSKYVMIFNPLSTDTPVHFYSVYRQQSKIEDQDRILYLKEIFWRQKYQPKGLGPFLLFYTFVKVFSIH